MANTIQCVSCKIVIDELLSYVQNKVSLVDEASLVRILSSAFTTDEIEKSKTLLFELVSSDLLKTVRKGKGKENRVLNDIISVIKVTEPTRLPIFVARDLSKLPPITFEHLDVSKLLKDLLVMQTEMQEVKSSYVTRDQLEDFRKECQNTKQPFTSVNFGQAVVPRGGESSNESHINESEILLTTCDNNICEKTSGSIRCVEGSSESMHQKTGRYESKNKPSEVNRGAGGPTEWRREVNDRSPVTDNEPSDQLFSAPQKQTYANALKDNDGFTTVQYKKQKSKNRLMGNLGTVVVASEEKFRAADRLVPMFITNVDKNAVESDIVNYIKNKTGETVKLEKISIRRQCEHDAYKFFVSQFKLSMFLDDKLWPQGVIFRRFVHFKPKRVIDVTGDRTGTSTQ